MRLGDGNSMRARGEAAMPWDRGGLEGASYRPAAEDGGPEPGLVASGLDDGGRFEAATAYSRKPGGVRRRPARLCATSTRYCPHKPACPR